MLSDRTIRQMLKNGNIIIIGELDDKQMQPASIDLRLGGIRDERDNLRIGPCDDPYPYMIKPQQFILGTTSEQIHLSPNIVGQVHGKSTRARQGLMVHAAGLVDPGFRGELTLELFNMSSEPIPLYWGMLICQITFDLLSTTPERLYGDPALFSRYQGQRGPTKAKAYKEHQ